MPKIWTRRIFKGFRVLAIVVILGIGALFITLWLEHRTGLTLPTPSGPLAVGRTIYAWADEEHPDTLSPVPGTKREFVVWIWYPSAAPRSATAQTSEYLPSGLRAAVERGRPALMNNFLTRDLSKVQTHSSPDADVSSQQSSFPVVIMRAGASAEVANYSTLAEDLASHGYVVVGFDAPYRTQRVVFPDGRVIARSPANDPELCVGKQQELCANRLLAAWSADISFVLGQLGQLNLSSGRFTGRLDMTRIGVFGHSFGGATAALFCHEDSRCKAGIDIDGAPHGGVIQAGINRPFMFLLSDHSHESGSESRQINANIQSIYDRLPPNGRLRIAIRGANHFTFSDDGALLKSFLMRGVLRVFGGLGIDGRRQLAVTAYCVHSFFDAFLKSDAISPLKISSPLYPEIEVLAQ